MPLSTVSVSLVGGPPWGFRIAQDEGELPVVSQVIINFCNVTNNINDINNIFYVSYINCLYQMD